MFEIATVDPAGQAYYRNFRSEVDAAIEVAADLIENVAEVRAAYVWQSSDVGAEVAKPDLRHFRYTDVDGPDVYVASIPSPTHGPKPGDLDALEPVPRFSREVEVWSYIELEGEPWEIKHRTPAMLVAKSTGGGTIRTVFAPVNPED